MTDSSTRANQQKPQDLETRSQDTPPPLSLNPWTSAGPPETNDQISTPGGVTTASLEVWVQALLDRQQLKIEQLLYPKDEPERGKTSTGEGDTAIKRTLENTLRLYDDAVATLAAAGSQTSLLDSVHPKKEVRDKARELTQRVAEAGTALSLNQEVFHALEAMDISQADPGTRHYVAQTLLNYRLAGVDKDEATRLHLRELSDRATELSLTFGKHVQEHVNPVEVSDARELEGLPEDYLKNHPAGPDGMITLTTDYPDMQPVMTFARNEELRLRMFRAYNTRAYPENRQVLLDLLKVRQEMASILDFASWADLATANQLIGSAANMKEFIDELERASRNGAEREYEMVLEFARREQPGLTALKSSDRGYWYEQYRRAAFDFDSQSVRPYFPYEQVEKGILETAERLFHVQFEPAPERPGVGPVGDGLGCL